VEAKVASRGWQEDEKSEREGEDFVVEGEMDDADAVDARDESEAVEDVEAISHPFPVPPPRPTFNTQCRNRLPSESSRYKQVLRTAEGRGGWMESEGSGSDALP